MGIRGALLGAALLVVGLPTTASAQATADANCPGGGGAALINNNSGIRVAQTFVVQNGGVISSANVTIRRTSGFGDYVIEIAAAPGGVPTHTTLASATIPDAAVPTGTDSVLTANFPVPLPVAAGEQYALAITRTNNAQLDVRAMNGNTCLGTMFYDASNPGVSYAAIPPGTWDMVFAIFVSPAPDPPADAQAPETTITTSPQTKTTKKQATFGFTSSEPGSGFECSLNGATFTSCTSPLTVKGKKGKNSFAVRAKDAAGNVDATPATFDWKVKKKRK